MISMEELKPTMQIQESHQIPTSLLVQEKPGLASPEHDDHQPQPQQQQQQQKRPNEGNSDEEEGKSTNTRECESGGKHEEENKEKISGDYSNNGGVLGPRERLKRHRREVAGQVWIPDIWGQEDFMKDWIDCSAFDASLVPQGIMLARASLMEEGRRSNSNTLRVENSC
ncbi:protein BIC1-like [Chenopodium quinoa]|uniref:protein BIC1-like n=1 Tax=Chenopodium quinoa TaxID=63459 RepID=UPI000B793DF7|nr:protein BIC1-like [Chenopodium quinoa]